MSCWLVVPAFIHLFCGWVILESPHLPKMTPLNLLTHQGQASSFSSPSKVSPFKSPHLARMPTPLCKAFLWDTLYIVNVHCILCWRNGFFSRDQLQTTFSFHVVVCFSSYCYVENINMTCLRWIESSLWAQVLTTCSPCYSRAIAMCVRACPHRITASILKISSIGTGEHDNITMWRQPDNMKRIAQLGSGEHNMTVTKPLVNFWPQVEIFWAPSWDFLAPTPLLNAKLIRFGPLWNENGWSGSVYLNWI